MIVKKLAAPLINEKILHEAEHCYIATASISETAFDFVKSRLSPKCKIDIVTGLDSPTSPGVLQRIWKHYQDRISLHVYTKNFFHPNVYIFDLPYRKAVAFVGSGQFTMEGLKDNEEIFYKIKDPKEIEALKSWFIGYYEFADPLSETIIEEYEWIYPSLKQREIESRQEKNQFIALTTGGFDWDNIKFKNQFFKKEDYLILASNKASLITPEIQMERQDVQNKLLALHELIKKNIRDLKLFKNPEAQPLISDLNPLHHPSQKIRTIWMSYGNDHDEIELKTLFAKDMQPKFMKIFLIIKPREVGVWLVPGREDRRHFNEQMKDSMYRTAFFKLLASLKIESKGNDYWFEIAGEKRTVENFQNEDAFWEFTKSDQALHYDFTIGKTYIPGASEINTDIVATTVTKEMEKLMLLYQHIKPSK